MKKRLIKLLGILYMCVATITVNAAPSFMDQWEERKSLPVQSNEIANWPEGPAIGAQSAILMEMNTHTILYAKNIDEKNYPASTTKILTCLLASKYCDLNEIVEFSYDACHSVPSDGSNMGMDAGEKITLEQAMYGILVGSANEAATAVGEHVAQKVKNEASEKVFAGMMNDYAKSIGCKNTHFVNANGLYDDNHYTTVYDLALIGCDFFNDDILCKMSSTPIYNIPATDTQPDDIWLNTKNQLYKGKPYEYKPLLGSKTGYVSQSRQTLVSAAQKDNMKLVCVVFVEESPYQYADTISLFNYGFDNFHKINISENETKYEISNDDVFNTDDDLLGNSSSLLSIDKNSYVVLPKQVSFNSVDSAIHYSEDSNDEFIATIDYTYNTVNVGKCRILYTKSSPQSITVTSFYQNDEANNVITPDIDSHDSNVIFINIKNIIIYLVIGAVTILSLIFIFSLLKSYNFTPRNTEDLKRRRKRNKEKRKEKRNINRRLKDQRKLERKKRKAYKKRR